MTTFPKRIKLKKENYKKYGVHPDIEGEYKLVTRGGQQFYNNIIQRAHLFSPTFSGDIMITNPEDFEIMEGNQIKTLDELGLKHKTDKSSMTHCYLDNYEKYFESWRDKEFVLLELGVAAGNSIRLWREYFTNAKVYGIDNNPDCAGEGIFIGGQTDKDFLYKVLLEIGGPSIIIDDASHYAPLTIETFEILFYSVKSGGYYIVEDTHCFYDKTYGLAPDFDKGMSKVFNFFTGLACDVDVHGRGMTGNVKYAMEVQNPNFASIPKYSQGLDSIHIHPSLWLFKRK